MKPRGPQHPATWRVWFVFLLFPVLLSVAFWWMFLTFAPIYLVDSYLFVESDRLPEGTVVSDWRPAPQDEVNSDPVEIRDGAINRFFFTLAFSQTKSAIDGYRPVRDQFHPKWFAVISVSALFVLAMAGLMMYAYRALEAGRRRHWQSTPSNQS